MFKYICGILGAVFLSGSAQAAQIASGFAQPGQFVEVLGPLSPGETTRLTFTVDVAQPLPLFVQQVTHLRHHIVQVLPDGSRNIVVRDDFPIYTCSDQSCPPALFANLSRSDLKVSIDIFALQNIGSFSDCDLVMSGQTCFSQVRSIGFRYLHQPDPTRGGFSWTLIAEAVPEPTTWSLMILGFGAIGAMSRLRMYALKQMDA